MLAHPARRFPGQHFLLIGMFLSKDHARLVSETFFFSGTHSLLGLEQKKQKYISSSGLGAFVANCF